MIDRTALAVSLVSVIASASASPRLDFPVDPCPGDVTGNGTVNPIDLAALLVGWGTDGFGEFYTDCNRDGIVDADDLAIVLADWGPCP